MRVPPKIIFVPLGPIVKCCDCGSPITVNCTSKVQLPSPAGTVCGLPTTVGGAAEADPEDAATPRRSAIARPAAAVDLRNMARSFRRRAVLAGKEIVWERRIV